MILVAKIPPQDRIPLRAVFRDPQVVAQLVEVPGLSVQEVARALGTCKAGFDGDDSPRAVFDSGMRNDGVVGVVSCGAALGSGTRKDDLLATIILEHFSPVAGATLVLLVTFFLERLLRQWPVQGS